MMFNIVDKDGDGRISFQEFLDTVVLFSKGRTEDKLRIIFDMCDNDRNGVIDKIELSEMLRSLVEIARTNNSLSDSQVTELIDGMFQSAGLEHKNALTYDDFKLMMKEYRGIFIKTSLQLINLSTESQFKINYHGFHQQLSLLNRFIIKYRSKYLISRDEFYQS